MQNTKCMKQVHTGACVSLRNPKNVSDINIPMNETNLHLMSELGLKLVKLWEKQSILQLENLQFHTVIGLSYITCPCGGKKATKHKESLTQIQFQRTTGNCCQELPQLHALTAGRVHEVQKELFTRDINTIWFFYIQDENVQTLKQTN